jgi:lysophospholipase L1-like esterase
VSNSRRKWNLFDWLIWLILAGGCWYLYKGFLGADMFEVRLEGGILAIAFPLATKIGIPLLFAVTLLIWYLYKTNKIPRAAVLFVTILGMVSLVGSYLVVANYYYTSALERNLDEYHPYLQLAPHSVTLRPPLGKDSAIRVFCLGGSTTEWSDTDGRGWPQRVDERLAVDNSAGIQVYNCGRMWYTTLHMLIHYETNLRHLKPDVLIVMEAVNDLLNNADFSYLAGKPFTEDYGHFYGPVARMVQKKPLGATIKTLIKSTWYAEPRDSIVTSTFSGLEPFTRNLRTIIDLAKLDSVPVVLMTQPYLTKLDMSTVEYKHLTMLNFEAVGSDKRWALSTALEGHRRYNEAIRLAAWETGVQLIDLESMVPKTLEYFTDDVHYTSKGYDLVGDSVAFYLQQSGVLEMARNK